MTKIICFSRFSHSFLVISCSTFCIVSLKTKSTNESSLMIVTELICLPCLPVLNITWTVDTGRSSHTWRLMANCSRVDRKYKALLIRFCQMEISTDFLSNQSFCQNIPNEFLSKFVEFLSNTGGYIDSVLFCQSLQSCLTEHFWCLTEILSRARFVWQNIRKMFKNHKSLLISGMTQYIEKSPWQKLQNHISQLLSGGFVDWSFSLGDQFKKLFLHFA